MGGERVGAGPGDVGVDCADWDAGDPWRGADLGAGPTFPIRDQPSIKRPSLESPFRHP